MRRGIDLGFCKPVGQSYVDISDLRVDKDTLLFSDLLGFDIQPHLHSPVILGSGATTDFLDNPQTYPYRSFIEKARDRLEFNKELVLYEGTGHPGVGSVVELSNAEVAHLTNSKVIFVAEGGIGSTIDMVNMNLALFRERGVEVIGLIVNKVREEKIDKLKQYLEPYYAARGIPLLGILPYDRTLAYPVMRTVCKALNGEVLANAQHLDNKIADILAGTVLERGKIGDSANLLLVVDAYRLDSSIAKLQAINAELDLSQTPLSGIITTGEGDFSAETRAYIAEHEIPHLHTNLDTYGIVLKISRIEVKINRNTPWKVKRAIELFESNVDLNAVLERIS